MDDDSPFSEYAAHAADGVELISFSNVVPLEAADGTLRPAVWALLVVHSSYGAVWAQFQAPPLALACPPHLVRTLLFVITHKIAATCPFHQLNLLSLLSIFCR